jgi:hypothetical protein
MHGPKSLKVVTEKVSMLRDGYGVGYSIYPHSMRQLIWSIADGTPSDSLRE